MNRLTKNERLHSRKLIEHLLTNGNSFFVHPFRVLYSFEFRATSNEELQQPNFQLSTFNFQFLITVPKRRIKKAVARNLIKRRTREAWRLHKNQLRITNYELREEVNYELGVKNQVSSIRYQEAESGEQITETNQQITKSTNNQPFILHLILQYVANEPLPYPIIEEAIKTVIQRLQPIICEMA
ncbi:MAG: ribonuclease P protein component [Prevotellaceae bacterium]|jgi:ribonuclease P protein component|nr:ribonuclease P protein component [Prevotellaceae bacterium]